MSGAIPESHLAQEVGAGDHAGAVLARDAQVPAAVGADGEHDRLNPLAVEELVQGEVPAQGAGCSGSRPRRGGCCRSRRRGCPAAGGIRGCRRPSCRRQWAGSRRPSPCSRSGPGAGRRSDPAGPAPTTATFSALAGCSLTGIQGVANSWSAMKRLTDADGDRVVDVAAAAALLAEGRADAAADQGEGVALAVDRQRLGDSGPGRERRRRPALDAGRAGVDALAPRTSALHWPAGQRWSSMWAMNSCSKIAQGRHDRAGRELAQGAQGG